MTRPLTRNRMALGGAALATAVATMLTLVGATSAQAIDAPAEYTNQNAWNNNIAPAVAAGNALDLGDLVVTLKPGAMATDQYPIASVTTAPGALQAPAGYNVQGQEFYLLDNTYTVAGSSYLRTEAKAAGRGLDGGAINYTDSDANHIAGAAILAANPGFTQSGYFRYILTLSSSINAVRPHQTGVAFYDAILYWDKATGLLSVVSGEPPVEKAATTTALTQSGVTANSATLTATVAPAAATGTVIFKQGGTTIGSPVAVSGGTANLTVNGLTPNLAHTFTAEYSGDATHEASTGTVSFNTLPAPDSSESDVNVTVPAPEVDDPTGLKISVKPSAVALSGAAARTAGSPWTATGSLGNVTVNDDRREATAQGWTLSGKAADFTGSGTAAGSSIAASNLGWTPAKVSGAGTQGALATDLSASRTLAVGTASADANVQTTVSAGLSLVVPADKQAGAYSSKITLILI